MDEREVAALQKARNAYLIVTAPKWVVTCYFRHTMSNFANP